MKTSSLPVSVAFTCAALAKIAFIVSCFMQYFLLMRAPFSPAEAHANDARQIAIARLAMPIALLAITVFLVWFYRTKKSAIRAGMPGTEYSPALSTGCFFIPVANFALPFQAMRELWKGSLNIIDWKVQRSSSLIGWWWASWIAYSIAPFGAVAHSKLASGIEGLKTTTLLLALSSLFAVISYALTVVVAHRVVRGINEQLERQPEVPNQSPVPATMAVTPPAAQESPQP